ncbi:enoyl-[acyl-carrier-protein] reductase (NADH) [Bradyrhizobium sp. LM3.2]
MVLPCDVEDIASVDATFTALREKWGRLDFVIHAIGFADKNELKGRYADTSRENFSRTMVISCFSFTEIAKRAAELMTEGGSMITLTFGASMRAMPNYNVMGVAKAALEASVRYLASDFGPRGIRVNAISAGPIRTLAGSGIGEARAMFAFMQKTFAASPRRDARRARRLGVVSVVGSLRRRDRRDPLCRFRLQHRPDAEAGRPFNA